MEQPVTVTMGATWVPLQEVKLETHVVEPVIRWETRRFFQGLWQFVGPGGGNHKDE